MCPEAAVLPETRRRSVALNAASPQPFLKARFQPASKRIAVSFRYSSDGCPAQHSFAAPVPRPHESIHEGAWTRCQSSGSREFLVLVRLTASAGRPHRRAKFLSARRSYALVL